jgi:hypothetical protein
LSSIFFLQLLWLRFQVYFFLSFSFWH